MSVEIRSLGGRDVPVSVRRSDRARRIGLTIDPMGGVELVVPRRVAMADAERFLESEAEWVLARLAAMPPRVPFAHDAVIPVLGRERRIVHLPLFPPELRDEGEELVVGGPRDDIAVTVTAWLIALARDVLGGEARAKAATLDLPVAGVTVRDQRTRWGSCSARGRLSLSWRLVLAPPDVRDYVVSHEVAHLKELNHGPNFWALVEWFCPGHARPRRWLRDNAKILQRYG